MFFSCAIFCMRVRYNFIVNKWATLRLRFCVWKKVVARLKCYVNHKVPMVWGGKMKMGFFLCKIIWGIDDGKIWNGEWFENLLDKRYEKY